MTISGEGGNVDLAERTLIELYGLIEKGYPLYQHDLEYAIRMVTADPTVRVADVFMDAVYTSYRKKVIAPKSVAQKRYVDAIRRHDVVFGIGPAGTRQTKLALAMPCAALTSKALRGIYSRARRWRPERTRVPPETLPRKVGRPQAALRRPPRHDNYEKADKYLERRDEVAPSPS